MSTDNKLLLEFEKEIWLYLDNDLSKERMQFWTKVIVENIELQELIDSVNSVSNLYHDSTNYNLDNKSFNKIIDKTICEKSIVRKVKKYFLNLLDQEEEHNFSKIVFASFLIVCAIVVSLVSHKPNSVKTMTNVVKSEVLEWDSKLLDNQINKIETLLLFAKNDNYKKYYIDQITSNKWNKDRFELENRIAKIKNDLGNNEF